MAESALVNRERSCPACSSTETEQLLSLDPIPIHVGLLWATPEAASACRRGEFRLRICTDCGYVWNAAFDPDLLAYEQDYDNALHHSPKFVEWERTLAESLIDDFDLRGRTLAEIGCGDGRFLALLADLGGNTGIGFEPGHNAARVSPLVADADIEILDQFVDASTLRDSAVDFVVARHVLEHVPEPRALLDAIRDGLRADGAVYIEVPNLAWALAHGSFEDFIYEHCGYYTPATLERLLHTVGFEEVRVEPTFDDLFVAARARRPSQKAAAAPAIARSAIEEIRTGVQKIDAYIREAESQLSEFADDGRKVVAWGGGARAVGLLNLPSAAESIDLVVDVNPRKQGTFVTGSGHAIVAPERLRTERPDAVLVVNPVYRDEIARMVADLGIEAEVLTLDGFGAEAS